MGKDKKNNLSKPSKEEAIEAVRTLIRWAGDDPSREGLIDTPKRVVNSYTEFFCGYAQDPEAVLSATFSETQNYDEMVILKNMRLETHCEHHMVPIIGKAHVGYLPSGKVVGLSKIARLVDVYAKRLQIQEKLTSQIADTLEEILKPKGVGVVIEAQHQCMTTRGVLKPNVSTITNCFLGDFKTKTDLQQRFTSYICTK